MKRRYYRRKTGIAKKEQPFFQDVGTMVQTKEERQPFFQTKGDGLKVGQPGDKYEQEADAMADAVVGSSPNGIALQRKEITGIQLAPEEEEGLQAKIQRQAAEEEPALQTQIAEEEEPVQMQAEEEAVQMQAEKEEVQMQEEEEEVQMQEEEIQTKEEEELQTKEEEEVSPSAQNKSLRNPQAGQSLSNRIKASSGNGRPLSLQAKQKMEGAFGADFGKVLIHTGTEAIQMNKELHSQAFAHGTDIYFNRGKYRPETNSGQHLLAHELTHVVQQNPGSAGTVQRACLPAAACPAAVPGSAGSFGTAEEAAEVSPRARRKRMACARATSTGHAGHARQLERVLSTTDPTAFSQIHGVFLDADMSRGTGAMVTNCADWAADSLPSGCDPPTISGASKPCVLVHGDLNREAYKFNNTAEPNIGGLPREEWRIQTVQTLIHEAQHVIFDEASRPEPAGVSASCTRNSIHGELSELNAILSEFPTVFRAIPASGPGRTRALERLNEWFHHAITNPFESIAGTLRAARCICDCSDVNTHVRDVFDFVSTGWTATEKTEFHTELRKASWDAAPHNLNWPL